MEIRIKHLNSDLYKKFLDIQQHFFNDQIASSFRMIIRQFYDIFIENDSLIIVNGESMPPDANSNEMRIVLSEVSDIKKWEKIEKKIKDNLLIFKSEKNIKQKDIVGFLISNYWRVMNQRK